MVKFIIESFLDVALKGEYCQSGFMSRESGFTLLRKWNIPIFFHRPEVDLSSNWINKPHQKNKLIYCQAFF
jgi:hypothetical protein